MASGARPDGRCAVTRAGDGLPGLPTLDFEALFEGLPTAYLVMTPDLVIAAANARYREVLERDREDLVGRYVFDAFPPAPDALDEHGGNPLQASFERVRDTGRPDAMPLHKYDVLDPASGTMVERYWSLVSAPLVDESGTTRLILQRVEDVTDYVRERAEAKAHDSRAEDWRRRAEAVEADLFARMRELRAARQSAEVAAAELEASERRARAVLDTAVDGIITIDGSGLIDSVNPAAERMFGYSARELVGRNVSMLMPEPYRTEHDGYMERYQVTREPRIIGTGREVLGQRRDGSTFPLEVAVSEVTADPPVFTGVVRDISDRKALEEQLVQQALHDPLTGLANRTLLLDRIDHALSRRHREPGSVALLFVDLDRFKLVNDSLGHEVGDELLVRTAARLRQVVRPEDLVARLGGDEFVVLCDALPGPAGAESMARRLVAALNAPVALPGGEVYVSASVGVVTDSGQRGASELLRDADDAMYQAKAQGRARYTLHDGDARAKADDRLQLGGELHRAVDRAELRALHQPIVDLRSGAVVATEALVRWDHPRRGVLPPGAFLPLAEEIGLSADHDRWMLGTACADTVLTARDLDHGVGVWVNLSGRSLADPGLPDTVARALESSGLDPELLTLELTEGTLLQNAPDTVRTLRSLERLGVRLAVDDFGTGFSSLSYLQAFPVHVLKVDRSFVARLDEEGERAESSAAIIGSIVSLAQGLGVRTVAEGIETPGQLCAVTTLGCDLGQGYFLGRPTQRENIPVSVRSGTILPAAMAADLPPEERRHLLGQRPAHLPGQRDGDAPHTYPLGV